MSGPRDALDIVNKFDDMDGTDYGDNPSNDTEDTTDDNNDADAGDDDSHEQQSDDDSGEEDSSASRSARGQDEGESEQVRLRALPGDFAQDEKGNLYDRNGRFLARAGSERRLYERSVRLQSEMVQKDQRIQNLENQLRSSGSIGEEPTRLGLNAEDLKVGYPIIAEFKRDPVTAARNVLEMVMGMGHNLSDILGQNAKDAVEMKAISRMLDERLAPLNELRQSAVARQREQEAARAANQEIETFFNGHEHSRVHADVIDNLLGRRDDLTPEKAYYELRVFAAQNGLDFSRPLAPQMQTNARRQPSNRQQTRSVPMVPQGRGGGNTSYDQMSEVESLSPNASWDDIIRRSLRS